MSRLMDLTCDMCVPTFRCIPEHEIQTNTPRFVEAHRGDGPLQSAHDLFSGSCLREKSVMGDDRGDVSKKSKKET